jgi:hypothetical protein
MLVDVKQQIRNATGTFACPDWKCWTKNMRGLVPGDEKCPDCGVSLEWAPETFEAREFWHNANKNRPNPHL